jgi:NodT family efflux transporter outer membrane factor (OMF) lipoprotein
VSQAVNPRWWTSFQSPQLNSLIERAIAGNLSLQQTVLRIAGAREQINQAGGAFLPAVNGSVKATRQQLGLEGELKSHDVYGQLDNVDPQIAGALGALTQPVNLYQGSFDAQWELDLWGKVRRQVEGAQAQQQQAIEQRNDALVSLEAEVARAWLQLRGAQSVISTLQTQIETAQQTFALTDNRQRSGLSPQMDVENARAQVGSLEAQLPQYQAQERQAMNALAILLGKPPGALDGELRNVQPLPKLPALVSTGIPSTLARRRPDIREAEASLHAATAQIGVSVAQLFPSLTLSGQFGLRNSETDWLTDWSSHFYSFGPQISIPIFQGGRLVSSVKLARAQQGRRCSIIARRCWKRWVMWKMRWLAIAPISSARPGWIKPSMRCITPLRWPATVTGKVLPALSMCLMPNVNWRRRSSSVRRRGCRAVWT